MLRDFKYEKHIDTPQQLAQRVIDKLREEDKLSFPIDPFELLSMNDIVYQFRDFKELGGIYIVPEDEYDIPIVGMLTDQLQDNDLQQHMNYVIT
ncbi:hypothetical protein [Haloplasma contractile]|uniref:Uncharacterized protein n=1 Tax=Haloplasma contractile SSD-17B TaxID=1033810 RepID=U2FIM2_9MOLU|nr:hypothetical protein [Haloplasma contractile]ERJ11084.1 hypothetical protein HLPCO_002905 [Haloplasma contractile SSD-17B]